MASPCKALLGPGRFDRSSAISRKPQSCVAIRSKPDGQGPKGFGVDGSRSRVSVFSPSSRSPLCSCSPHSIVSSSSYPPLPAKEKSLQALHVYLHHARSDSEGGQPYRHGRREAPRPHLQAMPYHGSMVPEDSYRHGSLHAQPWRERAKAVSGSPLKAH